MTCAVGTGRVSPSSTPAGRVPVAGGVITRIDRLREGALSVESAPALITSLAANRPDPGSSGPGLGAGVLEGYGEGPDGTPASSRSFLEGSETAQEPRRSLENPSQVVGSSPNGNGFQRLLDAYPERWLFGG